MVVLSSELLTVSETLDILRISKPTLFALIRDSRIPSLKITNRRFFRRSSITNWLEELETNAGKIK